MGEQQRSLVSPSQSARAAVLAAAAWVRLLGVCYTPGYELLRWWQPSCWASAARSC